MGFPDITSLLDEEQLADLREDMRQTLNRYPQAEWLPWLRAFHRDAERRESPLLLAAVESLAREIEMPLGGTPDQGSTPPTDRHNPEASQLVR
jgi:hypothetical protein